MDPPQFNGGHGNDGYEFLISFHERLHNLGLVEARRVDYTSLKMLGPTNQWWRAYIETRPVGSRASTGKKFTQVFLEKFVPRSMREERRNQFENLTQDGISVSEYKAKFQALSRHALMILPNEIERIRRFVNGLIYPIYMATFQTMSIGGTFHRVVDAAEDVEYMRRQELGEARDKSYLEVSKGGRSGQGSQGYSQRVSGHEVYLDHSCSTQQIMVPKTCYECGELGHTREIALDSGREHINMVLKVLIE
ncbi:hypothetical protein R3W88_026843 [Solanum pinnatisectum]|uniref:Retrotransposon gag domain-containing protein n=1 Tax=Solanum pinnatisectum TaxID=50273 RepID=A0AAV9LFC0_9SOLN|nr:hypothetical protein R3W88_026843 [Solanum pinnatisectum]